MTGRWLVHEGSGARCPCPPGWSTSVVSSAAVAALEPARDGTFRANLVLTVLPNGGLSFAQWQAHSDRVLPLVLRDYELIDLQKCSVATVPGGRRLSRYRAVDGRMLMLHQWFCAPGGIGVTLTSTCEVPSYAVVDERVRDAVARLLVPGRR